MFALYIDNNTAHWLAADGTLAHGDLGAAADAAQQRDVVVLVPAESILLTAVTLPPIRQAGRRLNAAKYALEEQLAARVETLHFTLAGKNTARGESTPIAVTDLERLRALMRTLADTGLNVTRVMPDALALPEPEPGQWQLYTLGPRILARTGTTSGFACEQPLWSALETGAQQQATHIVVQTDSGDSAVALAQTAQPADTRIECLPIQTANALIATLLVNATEHVPLNLCQGEFAPRSDWQRWWQPFKTTAALAAIWLILLLGTRAVATYQLHNRIDALQQRSLAAFNAAFPYVQNINNLRVQARQEIAALRRGGGGSGVYTLLQATAQVTSATPGISVETLQYREGELTLSLKGDSVQALEALKSGFKQQPQVQLEVERADAAAGGVRIRASVTPT